MDKCCKKFYQQCKFPAFPLPSDGAENPTVLKRVFE